MKKNCHNCKHLDHYEGYEDSTTPSGFSCLRRVYISEMQETHHLAILETEEYRLKYKTCCELKSENVEGMHR
jgi:hypothetical protein